MCTAPKRRAQLHAHWTHTAVNHDKQGINYLQTHMYSASDAANYANVICTCPFQINK